MGEGLQFGRAPDRDTGLPFLYTAPVALMVAGGLLLRAGGVGALTTPWSATVLSLTHVVTLGFLTMTAVGLFLPLVAVSGNVSIPRPRLVHGVYYSLAGGGVALVWGTARSEVTPVFVAIGALSLMGLLFLGHAIRSIRRSLLKAPTVRGLRVALWSFFLAVSLGIWLAHGHGGMLFPGPRAWWLGVHVGVALGGWLGAVIAASSFESVAHLLGIEAMAEKPVRWLLRGLATGVTLPVLGLLAHYFRLIPADFERMGWALILLGLPGALSIWVLWPLLILRSARDARSGALRDGLLLSAVSGLLLWPLAGWAWMTESTRWVMALGWMAVMGWGVSALMVLLVWLLPRLLSPPAENAEAQAEGPGARSLVFIQGVVAWAGAVWIGASWGPGVFIGFALMAEGAVCLALLIRQRRAMQVSSRGRAGTL